MTTFGRRGFLKLLGLGSVAAAATTLMPELPKALAFVEDPERALWIPGQRKIFDLHQPVREATLAEQAALTGEHMLRIRRGNDIFVMSEKAYVAGGGLSGLDEVHFDNGTIAYLATPGTLRTPNKYPVNLEEIRKIVNAHQASMRQRQEVPKHLYREDFARRTMTWGTDAKRRSEALMKAHNREARQQREAVKRSTAAQMKRLGLKVEGPADPDRIILTDQD